MDFNTRGQAAIGLVAPQHDVNIGGVLRAAEVYAASMVAIQGVRYRRAVSDTGKSYRSIPVIECDSLRDVIPFDCIPVAVEIVAGARPLPLFNHPESAFYVFGPENESLGRHTLEWCKYVVQVPGRYCMNLAATVNVVLYDRMAKQWQLVGGW